MKNTFEVISLAHVNVNGAHAGRACDVLANYKNDIADIQAGLETFEAKLREEISIGNKALGEAGGRLKKAQSSLDKSEEEKAAFAAEIKELEGNLEEAHRLLSLPERERQAEAHEKESARLAAIAAELRKG